MEQNKKTKLLVVEDVFFVEGRGVIVMPKIPVNSYGGACSRIVTLRKADGHEQTTLASLDTLHVTPPPPTFDYLCVLAGLSKDDIPIGTEIWIDDDVIR